MKKTTRFLSLALSLVMFLAALIPCNKAEAASRKVTVYVISTYGKLDINYSSKGLIKSVVNKNKLVPHMQLDYSYNGKKIKQVKWTVRSTSKNGTVYDMNYDYFMPEKTLYSYDKKNRIKEIKDMGGQIPQIKTYKYDSKNRIKSIAVDRYYLNNPGKDETYNFDYSKKNSIIVASKFVRSKDDNSEKKEKHVYDSNGNIKSIIMLEGNNKGKQITYKNVYDKNKRLKKVTVKDINGDKSSYTIKYKKIVVNKDYEDVINQQQKSIINGNYLGEGDFIYLGISDLKPYAKGK